MSTNSSPVSGGFEQSPVGRLPTVAVRAHLREEHGQDIDGPGHFVQTRHAQHHLELGHLLDHVHSDMPEKQPKLQPTLGEGIFNDRRNARYV